MPCQPCFKRRSELETALSHLRSLLAITVAASLSLPALAQSPAAMPTATPTPGAAAAAPAAATPGVVATTNNPNLAVATVKLENGTRTSKIVGTSVYGDNSTDSLGSIDDLILTEGDKVTVAIVSVGGVLGLGAKLVAIPFKQLTFANGKTTLPGATKDTLGAMPSFVY